jgi:hypothetical protein
MRRYIDVVAPQYQLPPDLVAAIVQVESAGDRFAMRHEPAYPWLWDMRNNRPFRLHGDAGARRPPAEFPSPHGATALTEWIGQQTSWGLMQVMGAVAREFGFKGHFPGLCDPLEGLHYGCKLLVRLRDRYHAMHGWAGVVDAYNDGTSRIERDFDYPHKVAAVSPEARALLKL